MQQLFGCLANCCEAGRKLKKLARSQVPDSDCDYDEVSSCYRCWLCQIWEISTAPPTHAKAPNAGQLCKQRGSAASVSISSTKKLAVGFRTLWNTPLIGYSIFMYSFWSALDFQAPGANPFKAFVNRGQWEIGKVNRSQESFESKQLAVTAGAERDKQHSRSPPPYRCKIIIIWLPLVRLATLPPRPPSVIFQTVFILVAAW